LFVDPFLGGLSLIRKWVTFLNGELLQLSLVNESFNSSKKKKKKKKEEKERHELV
jgi:hypothetical protein